MCKKEQDEGVKQGRTLGLPPPTKNKESALFSSAYFSSI